MSDPQPNNSPADQAEAELSAAVSALHAGVRAIRAGAPLVLGAIEDFRMLAQASRRGGDRDANAVRFWCLDAFSVLAFLSEALDAMDVELYEQQEHAINEGLRLLHAQVQILDPEFRDKRGKLYARLKAAIWQRLDSQAGLIERAGGAKEVANALRSSANDAAEAIAKVLRVPTAESDNDAPAGPSNAELSA